MTPATNKMICLKCGAEMNHHADKPIDPLTAEEARRVDPAFGAVIQEMHCCPGCGAVASRPADAG